LPEGELKKMEDMRKWIFLVYACGILFGLSSCSSYYYSTLASNDRSGSYNVNNDFVIENDSVCIIYSFYGEDGPVSVIIQNKLDEPLFVDWERSALIVNGRATSYCKDAVPIEGVTESSSYGSTYNWDRQYGSVSSRSRGTFSGEMQVPKGIEFVPPRAQIESSDLTLNKLVFDIISREELIDQRFAKADGSHARLKAKKFRESNSPLQLRSFLAFFTGGENGRERHYSYYETSFYLSELVKAGNLAPSNFQAWRDESGNFFYNCDYRSRRIGWIWGAVALGAAGLTTVILLATKTPSLDMPDMPHF
jgi:hypothetical protein